jgi:hypothetical protein
VAWQSLGQIQVGESWQYFSDVPEQATVIRLAGGSSRQLCWFGFFKTTDIQAVGELKAFRAYGTWRLYWVPAAPFSLKVGAVLPRPRPRYPEPVPFSLSCSAWLVI